MTESPMAAADLRAHMAELESERIRKRLEKRAAANKALDAFCDEFLHQHMSETEIAAGRAKVRAAAEHGEFEALVMRLPAKLCSDGGRAINDALESWEQTLTGKAAELYATWREQARGRGFGLRAMILNFPDGMPGDVGLFISWAPPAAWGVAAPRRQAARRRPPPPTRKKLTAASSRAA